LPTIDGIKLDPSYVESIDVPFNNISIADNWYGGSGYTYFAGPHDISSFSVTFYEDQKVSTLKYILAWKNLVKDFDSGFYNLPGLGDGKVGYKRSMRLLFLDSKNNAILQADLEGIWPADTGNLSLNYTDSGRITISQTFSCDNGAIKPLV